MIITRHKLTIWMLDVLAEALKNIESKVCSEETWHLSLQQKVSLGFLFIRFQQNLPRNMHMILILADELDVHSELHELIELSLSFCIEQQPILESKNETSLDFTRVLEDIQKESTRPSEFTFYHDVFEAVICKWWDLWLERTDDSRQRIENLSPIQQFDAMLDGLVQKGDTRDTWFATVINDRQKVSPLEKWSLQTVLLSSSPGTNLRDCSC